VASGPPLETIEREKLEETYETRIELVETPASPVPIVIAH
jgi:ABC-type hemin transport system ATPase subunit